MARRGAAMSYVIAAPVMLAAAAADVAAIGSLLHAANAVAPIPTTGVVAAAGDKASAGPVLKFLSSAHPSRGGSR
jgi:hypothetical protein